MRLRCHRTGFLRSTHRRSFHRSTQRIHSQNPLTDPLKESTQSDHSESPLRESMQIHFTDPLRESTHRIHSPTHSENPLRAPTQRTHSESPYRSTQRTHSENPLRESIQREGGGARAQRREDESAGERDTTTVAPLREATARSESNRWKRTIVNIARSEADHRIDTCDLLRRYLAMAWGYTL